MDAEPATGRAARPRRRILVLDDNDMARSAIVRVLRKHGYETHAAATGADALVLLQDFSFGLMYCDVNLDDESGIDLLPLVFTIAPMLPVVMLSGMNEAALVVEAMRAGAVDYVTKPLETSKFLAITERLAGGGASAPAPVAVPRGAAPAQAGNNSPLELQQALANRRLVEILDRLVPGEAASRGPTAVALAPGRAPAVVPPPTWDPPLPQGPVPIVLVPARPAAWRLGLTALLGRFMPRRFAATEESWAA